MNVGELQTKKDAVEARFNELAAEKENIEKELYRLQGEFRSLTALIEGTITEEVKQDMADTEAEILKEAKVTEEDPGKLDVTETEGA